MALSALLIPPSNEEHCCTIGSRRSHDTSCESRSFSDRRAALLLTRGVEDAAIGNGASSSFGGPSASGFRASEGRAWKNPDRRVDIVHERVDIS